MSSALSVVRPPRVSLRLGAALSLLLAVAGRAQNLEFAVQPDDFDPASADKPFGLAFDPDGRHVYAALAGNLSFASPQTANNDNVVKIDARTGVQTAVGQTGLYPEDVAVARDAAGQARHVYVSDSTSGTITCLTPDLATVVATIPLSPCFGSVFFGAFPYAVLLSPDMTRLYVTTAGGCDAVDVIDVDPSSASFHTWIGSFTVPGSSGRPTWRNATEIVFPITVYDTTFSNSQAGFAVVDPANPGAATSYPVAPGAGILGYHSANEAVVVPGDKVLVPVFGGNAPTLVEASLATGAVLRTLTMSPALTSPTLHGLAVSADGLRAAVTSFTGGDTVLVDLTTFAVAGFYDHGATSTPNDAVFSPDGARLVVTLQGAARVDVLKDLPGYELRLATPTAVAPGASFVVEVADCEAESPFGVFVSTTPGPTVVAGYVLQLGLPLFELFSGVGGPDGTAAATFVMPVLPGLSGTAFYTQAATIDRDGDLRLSNGTSLVVL